ncbi:unnamed protein product [Allacma fusca]|uniref:Uncharacterized protein n=1 Tax=Allacma fusca TaxID=39272 RepID=A0A8J2LYZ5_9HEXA|nr:unnamed protein product [Allacma fusca]
MFSECSNLGNLVSLNDDEQVLSLNEEFSDQECFLSEVTRPDGNVGQIKFSEPEKFEDNVADISEKEFLMARCGKYYNLEANFLVKTKIQRKINHWKAQKNRPISILSLNFDSFPRNYFRRLPQTLRLLTTMGFLDFKGFQSVAPSSVENFLGLLTGMETSTVLRKCAPSSPNSTFDACPFVWKYYNENNFVSMFTGDDSPTFSWNLGEGFRRNPTDYYTYPLFQSRGKFRQENSQSRVSQLCMGQYHPQKFIFDYVQRFLTKFEDTPFFSFVWNKVDFHDSDYFGRMDNDFALLLQAIGSLDILERTMIIIIGSNWTNYENTQNVTHGRGFFERPSSALFIRAPQHLFQKYPHEDMKNSLELNTKRLVTGYDINHTLKHLLVLNGMNFQENVTVEATDFSTFELVSIFNFLPSFRERSSLLVPVNEERTCADVKIRENNCACRTNRSVTGKFY